MALQIEFHMQVENEASTLVHGYYCVLVITVASCFSYVLWSILLALNEEVITTTDKGREWKRNVKPQANFQERRKVCQYNTARASMLSSSQRVSFPKSSAPLPNYDLNNNSVNCREKNEDQGHATSAPQDTSRTLQQLAFLAQQLDELQERDTREHPRSFEDAFSASSDMLSRSASFSELANRTCKHLNISKFDLWRNKPLWTSLKKTWESNKLCAAEHEESKMDVIVRKKHEIYAATMEAMEADSPLDQDARNSFAEKERHNLNAPVTGHLRSRMSSKPASSIKLWIPSPSPLLTPATPSQKCKTLDFVARDRTTPQQAPSSPATPVMACQRPMYATNVLTTDAFRRVVQDKSCRYLS
jgi:hypothetical protein